MRTIEDVMLALLDNDVNLTNHQWTFVKLFTDVAKDGEIILNGKSINFAERNPDYFYYHIYNYVMWMVNNNAMPTNEELEPFFSGDTSN